MEGRAGRWGECKAFAAHTPRHTGIVDARIVVRPGNVIERGSIEMRDGVIVDVRAGRREVCE